MMELERQLEGALQWYNEKGYGTFGYTSDYEFSGEVTEKGYIRFAKTPPAYYDRIQNGLYTFLLHGQLPTLTPAQLDGKPTKQGIIFGFSFQGTSCKFTCKLLTPSTKEQR